VRHPWQSAVSPQGRRSRSYVAQRNQPDDQALQTFPAPSSSPNPRVVSFGTNLSQTGPSMLSAPQYTCSPRRASRCLRSSVLPCALRFRVRTLEDSCGLYAD
jgi:hypothetical protein